MAAGGVGAVHLTDREAADERRVPGAVVARFGLDSSSLLVQGCWFGLPVLFVGWGESEAEGGKAGVGDVEHLGVGLGVGLPVELGIPDLDAGVAADDLDVAVQPGVGP